METETTDMTEQPRKPAGSPDGGQFNESGKPESDLELEVSNYDRGIGWSGSWYAVPDFLTAEQVHNFFAEHNPPDEAVARMRRLVNQRRSDEASDHYRDDFNARVAQWDAENPAPGATKRKQEKAAAEHESRREAFLESLKRQMWDDPQYQPVRIDNYDAFSLCRVLGEWTAGRKLPPDEQAKLERFPSGFRKGPERQIAGVSWVAANYRLDQIADEALDLEADRREILELLRKLNEQAERSAWTENSILTKMETLPF